MCNVIVTVDLGFGDAGKGSIVDYLTRLHAAHTVVRFNGGAQAAHRVVDVDGRVHVFSQFGSGTLAGAGTHLSRFMLLDPLAMAAEAAHLQTLGIADPFAHTTVDEDALLITPFTRAVNRLRELARRRQRHGSCGVGIGETVIDALQYGEQVPRAGDLGNLDKLCEKLRFVRDLNLRKLAGFAHQLPEDEVVAVEQSVLLEDDSVDWLLAQYAMLARRVRIVTGGYLHDLLRQAGTVLFEAAQGVLLDEWRGFHPHTTWSTTTTANADLLLAAADFAGPVMRLGITRAYTTRHGAGPLVTEDPMLNQALPDAANLFGEWQQGFRVGWLDAVLLRYARDVVGPLDGVAVTCLDRLADLNEVKICRRYNQEPFVVDRIQPSANSHDLAYQSQITQALARCSPIYETVDSPFDLLPLIQEAAAAPITLISCGETAAHKETLQAVRAP